VYDFVVRRDDPIIEVLSSIDGAPKFDFYPASALKVTGLTEAERRDERLMAKLRNSTSEAPEVLTQKLDEFIEHIRASQVLNAWGITILKGLQVTGKVLEPPVLKFRTQQAGHLLVDVKPGPNLDFTAKLPALGVAVPPRFNSAPLIVVPELWYGRIKSEFIPAFIQIARQMDIPFRSPDIAVVTDTQFSGYRTEICLSIQQSGSPSYVLVIFSDVSQERYDALKQLLTIDLGIPSQFAKVSSIFDDSRVSIPVCVNLLLQITAKTGGIPFYVAPEALPLLHTMIIAISVSFKKSGLAVVGLSSSYDQSLARYKTAAYPLTSPDPIVPAELLTEFVNNAIQRFVRQAPQPPERVVVFRDGLSYALMGRVKKEEAAAVQSAIGKASLLYCVVQKRSMMRFLKADDDALPGTVVFDRIGSKDVAEFYLLSDNQGQGIASPTRYTILHHAPVVWNDDHFVHLCHYLSCSYPTSGASVRTPLALMVAEKLAGLCTRNLDSTPPNDYLSDFLHFL
jgi:hypothetical protein